MKLDDPDAKVKLISIEALHGVVGTEAVLPMSWEGGTM